MDWRWCRFFDGQESRARAFLASDFFSPHFLTKDRLANECMNLSDNHSRLQVCQACPTCDDFAAVLLWRWTMRALQAVRFGMRLANAAHTTMPSSIS